MDAVGPTRDWRVVRGDNDFEEEQGEAVKIGWGLREHAGEPSQDIDQLSDDDRRPTKTM